MNYQSMPAIQPGQVYEENTRIFSNGPSIETSGHSARDRESIQRVFPADTPICGEGEERELVLYILKGIARVSRATIDGNRKIVAFLYPGEMFAASVEGECRYSIDAQTSCEIRLYPWTAVTDWIENDPDLAEKFVGDAVKNALSAHEHLVSISQRCATQRLCTFLMEIYERERCQNNNPVLKLGIQRDIADYLGLTVETVCRQLTMLKEKGIIKSRNRRTFEVLDVQALMALSGEPGSMSHCTRHNFPQSS